MRHDISAFLLLLLFWWTGLQTSMPENNGLLKSSSILVGLSFSSNYVTKSKMIKH